MNDQRVALLDGNVLIALLVDGHVHRARAVRWFSSDPDLRFATCPITEGSLVREVVRGGDGVAKAVELLRGVTASDRHEFWPDDLSYADVRWDGVIGHRQVTDAYLAESARRREARLVTFDKGLAALHDDVAELVPVGG